VKQAPTRRHRRCGGTSYIEVLIATVLVAVALVPALEALQSGLMGSRVEERLAVQHYRLTERLEEVAAEPFGALAAEVVAAAGAPSSYSDPPGPDRRVVTLSFYDGDNLDDANPFTGTDPELVWIQVALENTPSVLATLVAR